MGVGPSVGPGSGGFCNETQHRQPRARFVIGAIALALALAAATVTTTLSANASQPAHTTAPATAPWYAPTTTAAPRLVPANPLPPCPGIVVVVDRAYPLDCDVSPPNILVELGLTAAECDQTGGRWHERAGLCSELDY